VKALDSAVKFNTEAVETLSERVKALMLDSNKWKDDTDIAIHWLNYTLYNQSNTFTYVRQLEFAILELRTMVKEVLISLEHYDREIVYESNSTRYVKEYS